MKHIDWVQKELDTLEKAGVITRSVLPCASPIVIVPKRTVPEEPPKKRLCVDYRVINSLLPKINKAHSKAKGVLTLVPLSKIDEIYARLKGSKIYIGIYIGTFDFWRRNQTSTREIGEHQEMPPPTTPKEVKQFLGLIGY